MSSTYGENLKLSIFGQSHGPAIGMTLDGIPAGLPVNLELLQEFLNRRSPGRSDLSTLRKEEDNPEFLSGIVDGYTCGAPIAAVIRNTDVRSSDYDELKDIPRPGHADYTAHVKYGGYQDASGGGHFSGRLTAPLCIAGGLCKQWLEEMGIRIGAHIYVIGDVCDDPFDPLSPQLDDVLPHFPVLDAQIEGIMRRCIEEARSDNDSIGGTTECAIVGVPAGIGEPMFGGIESRIAQIVYGIPAVKGLSFGNIGPTGSLTNDEFFIDNGQIKTRTNRCGGVLGGISNGMPIIFRADIKPTPSISRLQSSINLRTLEETELKIQGRHDPCIVPRVVPVIEAAAAIAIYDLILGNSQTNRRK